MVSTDDIDAINVAATCKHDRPELRVCLISFSSSGSCRTRAERAQLDGILDKHDFVMRYTQSKRVFITRQLAPTHAATQLERIPDPLTTEDVHEIHSARGAITLYRSSQRQETPSDTPSERHAFFLPVVSGSGGSGKSTISALTGLFGVGVKVANCVSLFGLHHTDAFPVDVWMKRILAREYPDGYPYEKYSPYNGICQQYMFAYYRHQQIQ